MYWPISLAAWPRDVKALRHTSSDLMVLNTGLDHGVIVAVATPAHRRDEAVLADEAPIVGRAILAAAIGMVDQARRRSSENDGAPQGFHCQASFLSVAHRPTDDFARVEIEHDGEIKGMRLTNCF